MNKRKIKLNININLFGRRIPLAEQVLFTKHLSMMLSAGISEVESLRIIQEQTQNKSFRALLDKVIISVEKGQFLSESLKEHRGSFGELFINIVRLGETSGTLSENLEYLSDEIKKKQDLKSKVTGAMVYPVVVLLATVTVVASLLVFVLPKITPIFQSLKVELPATTRFLLASSDFLRINYLWVILGTIMLMIIFRFLLRLPDIRYFLNKVLLLTPIAGKMAKDYNLSNISRTLGLLLKSGVEIVTAVAQTSDSVANPVYKKALLGAVEDVKKGRTMYTFLSQSPGLFPPTFIRMVQIGERTGNLSHNLSYLSGFYEGELNDRVRNLSSILEPVLMVVLGVLVGFVALSIITPIYEITQSI